MNPELPLRLLVGLLGIAALTYGVANLTAWLYPDGATWLPWISAGAILIGIATPKGRKKK